MDSATVLVRIVASVLVVAGAAALFFWLRPDEAEVTPFYVALVALSAILGAAVLASLWRK